MLGINRILFGIVQILAGFLKLALGNFQHAWCTQLAEIKVPYIQLFYWFIPLLEIVAGLLLIVGFMSRIAAFAILPIMAVAIYLYFTVSNPEAFLAQPHEAMLPPIMVMMAILLLLFGGGRWSLDLKKSIKFS